MRASPDKAMATGSRHGPSWAVDAVIRGAFVTGVASLVVAVVLLVSSDSQVTASDPLRGPLGPVIAERPAPGPSGTAAPPQPVETTGSVPPVRLKPTITP